jgi:asparagine synthase (glutamine-hydrolysing)
MYEPSVGVVLSGGLDSSIVTAAASRVRSPDSILATYSGVFPGQPTIDEGWKIHSLTSSLGVQAEAFEPEPQGSLWLGLQYLKDWALPLPAAGAVVDMALVAQAAQDGVQIVLDGQTGDETLGFAPYLVSDRLRRGRLLSALALSRKWPLGRPATRREKIFILKNLGLKGALPRGLEDRRRPAGPPWLVSDVRKRYLDAEDPWAWKKGPSGPRWWQFLSDFIVDMPHRYSRLDLLRQRAAAVGTTSESPLFDFDLIDYCLRLPPELAFSPDYTRPLAREAVRGVVPDEVRLNNTKADFATFCFDVLTGADAPGIERLLTDPDAELRAYVDMEWLRRRWHERPERGTTAGAIWGTHIWMLAATECWLRAQAAPEFLDEMLERHDVRRPALRRAVPTSTGTFSRLAGPQQRVYG